MKTEQLQYDAETETYSGPRIRQVLLTHALSRDELVKALKDDYTPQTVERYAEARRLKQPLMAPSYLIQAQPDWFEDHGPFNDLSEFPIGIIGWLEDVAREVGPRPGIAAAINASYVSTSTEARQHNRARHYRLQTWLGFPGMGQTGSAKETAFRCRINNSKRQVELTAARMTLKSADGTITLKSWEKYFTDQGVQWQLTYKWGADHVDLKARARWFYPYLNVSAVNGLLVHIGTLWSLMPGAPQEDDFDTNDKYDNAERAWLQKPLAQEIEKLALSYEYNPLLFGQERVMTPELWAYYKDVAGFDDDHRWLPRTDVRYSDDEIRTKANELIGWLLDRNLIVKSKK